MNLSYYFKKRLTDIIISFFMLVFLFFTLLPIGWMVYSSLKDSTDIAIGKVGLRRAGTDILLIKPIGQELLVLAADGGLNRFQAADLKLRAHYSYKTAATSYLLDGQYIWLFSADKGLYRIDQHNFKQHQRVRFDLPVIDYNKVTTTYLAKINGKIVASLDYKSFSGVWQFDPATLAVKFIREKKHNYFPERKRPRPLDVAAFAGIDSEIFVQVRDNNVFYLGGSSGKLFRCDAGSKQVLGQTRLPNGHLLIRFNNYIDMWKNVNFGLYLRNSLIICGFTMVFAMIFATFAAYALSRFRFPGSDLFSNAILATQMIPMIMYLIPIYIMFVKFTTLTGIPVKGTFPGIILIYSAWFLPFSIWILRGFFAAIPRELEEAALIDGCSRLRVFWHVALPLAMPGIIATGIYVFLNAWDELMFAWVLTNADTMTIPVGIRLFVGNYQNRFDLMMAAATVATLPVVVIFFLLQRHIVRGLTAGAVKG